ncbi:unnamed protein product, partial [marine sediment metagenome]
MKEEELLLIKEQMSRAKWSKYGLSVFGIVVAIFGIIATEASFNAIIFVQFGIIYCMIAQVNIWKR